MLGAVTRKAEIKLHSRNSESISKGGIKEPGWSARDEI